ncbi:MAG: hypothetical protein KIS78_27245 [Labilithrix sp.]|nr:hypothetical protein [Labilithrix sp.]MCW5836127.1 hypothetical protein [Labilithrix sp.]
MASRSSSLVLRLTRAALERRDAVARLAASWQARSLFAFKCDELAFARALLARRTNLWLYRTSQRAFAGDFIVVDVSSPVAASRPIRVLELKRGAPARVGPPTSVQLRNAPAALRELARTGVVSEDAPVRAITGDAAAILALLS